MTRPDTRRRRRDRTEPVVAIPPRDPAADQGATLNLQDPASFLQWLASNADGFQHNGEQLREKSRELWAAASEHDRNVQDFEAEIRDKQAQIDDLKAKIDDLHGKRNEHLQLKEMRAAEARQFDERAQLPETAAADIHAAIPILKQAIDNAARQVPPPTTPTTETPADPTPDPRLDGPMDRFNDAHDEHEAETGEQAAAS